MAKLQDARTTAADECQAMLNAATAYEMHAQHLDEEAERLRTLARQAREQEANLRKMALPEDIEACPLCGSEAVRKPVGRWDDTGWRCTHCTWKGEL